MKNKLCFILTVLLIACSLFVIGCGVDDGGGSGSAGSDFVIAETEYGRTLLTVTQEGSEKAKLTVPNGVECIGMGAFLPSVLSLSEVIIPDSVTRINDGAFSSCLNLRTVSFGANSKLAFIGTGAFSGCVSLRKFTLPKTVVTIGDNIFNSTKDICVIFTATEPILAAQGLDGARHILVPDNSFEEYKNKNASIAGKISKQSSLSGDFILDGTKLVSYIGIAENVTVPANITEIAERAFYQNEAIMSVNLSNCEIVGNSAFYECKYLKTVNFGTKLKTIENSSFYNCDRLAVIDLPQSVETIGSQAFSNCGSLYSATINAETIGSYAFYNCANLYSVTINAETIESYAFVGCSNLPSVTINAETIGNSAFGGCTNISSAVINVKTIGNNAFSGCNSLSELTLAEGLTTLGNAVFSNCTALTEVTLPSTLTSVGYSIFYNCSMLEIIEIKGTPYDWNSNWKEDCSATVIWDRV